MAVKKYKVECEKLSPSFQANFLSFMDNADKKFVKGFLMGRYSDPKHGCYHMSNEDLWYKDHRMVESLKDLGYGRLKNVQEVYQEMYDAGYCRGYRQREEEQKSE